MPSKNGKHNAKHNEKHNGKYHRPAGKNRPGWRGLLSFGLVSFPVEAVNAVNREASDIHFHQLHAQCHNRIHYKKVCPVHGEVPNDEIVSGYEYEKGKYIEIKPDELDALRSESDRALKIDAFVSPETIDPLYFDGRMYYLMPAETAAQESYRVLAEAMKEENCYGVGQMIFSGKDQLALVRPLDGVLQMAMLNYDAEIRSPKSVAEQLDGPKGIARQVKMARTLIQQWSEDAFDFSAYHDMHRAKVTDLIEAKKRGRAVVAPEEEHPKEALSLMDALKRSMARHPKSGPKAKKPSRVEPRPK